MATNYDLKLVVDADTTEAQRKLDALAAAHNSPEVQAAAERARAAMPQPSPERAQPAPRPPQPAPQATQPAAPARQPAPMPSTPTPAQPPRQNPNNPEDFGRRAGDVAGKAIGKAVAGFMAHEVMTLIFNSLKTTGGDNRAINQAEAGVGGALRYGTMGMMLGGAPGAIVGAVAGGVIGLLQEQQRQRKVRESRDNEMKLQERDMVRGVTGSASDSAFTRSLELAGGWRQRREMIRARRNEIEHGEGGRSIDTLKKNIKDADPESDYGKELAQILQVQMGRWASLARQEIDEGLAVAPGRLDAGSAADSWAKRGVFVGAQVDVAQVNEKIMGEVQSCRVLLEKIASMGTDKYTTIGNVLSAVYE